MYPKIVIFLTLIFFIGCGGESLSNSQEEDNNDRNSSLKGLQFYGFKLNFVDYELRYDMESIDPITHRLVQHYFDFDSNTFELDTKEKQIFINGKRRSLEDISYELDNRGNILARLENQEVFRLSMIEQKKIQLEKLEEYRSDILIKGQQYVIKQAYLANLYTIKDLASDDLFDSLSEFTIQHKIIPFTGGVSSGLVFSGYQQLQQREDNNYTNAGTYAIKEIDNQEVLFIYPNDVNRYGNNLCYKLDFSRVWKAECHLKSSNEKVKFYDKAIYKNVLEYMQTHFVNVDITI